MRRTLLTLLVALLGLVLLGVGGGAVTSWAQAQQAADRSADSPFMGLADPAAPYDQRFIDEMLMHHQGAIMSAQMMIGNSQRPELRDLAGRIVAGQQRQIDRMRAWRAQWYGSSDPAAGGMDPMGGMMGGDGGMMGGQGGMMGGDGGMMGGQGGMMGGQGMGGMMGGQGTDRMFLRMMIPHHQLAIDMANDALANAEHDELKGLAREIVADQSAEITEMEGYLRDWYGEGSTRDTAASMRDMMRRMMGR